MAIVFQSDEGFFICHHQYSEETLGRSYRKVLFDIRTPFLKDLEAIAIANSLESGIEKPRKRKRYQPLELPVKEDEVMNFLMKLEGYLLGSPTAEDFRSNNRLARDAAKSFMLSTETVQNDTKTLSNKNNLNEMKQLELWNDLFYLPSNSQFYRNKIENIMELTKEGKKFSLIIIDPPWNNRFIKRKWEAKSTFPSYHTLENEMLVNIPINELSKKDTLVAVWCTNSSTHNSYLMDVLLPKWQLEYIGTWYWIKVTKFGKLVCPWNGPSGKHPFERVVFARPKANGEQRQPFPERKLIVSVPCAIHSFKPPLLRVLQPFITDNRCLELFARSLLPNTTSWGDQLPLLQHSSLFEQPVL